MQRRKRERPDGNNRFGWELQPTLEKASPTRSMSQVPGLSVAGSFLPQALIRLGRRLT
jgi:hypothetical protein